jgi:23S rRNA (cytosine1962-C5)-methyltransferase
MDCSPVYRHATHALIDAGDERRLDRFGAVVVDRPAPAAIAPRRDPEAWSPADARFDRFDEGGVVHAGWTTRDGRPIEPWTIVEGGLTFELRLAPSGQVGYFPEQAANRRWIGERVVAAGSEPAAGYPAAGDAAVREPSPEQPAPHAAFLNLFGHTGGSTLAAIAGGAQATHVDASRPAVAWARRNAELSGLAERPVRWIADDVRAFVRREYRRGRRYTGIALDPPSYGHGPGGQDWRLERDLPPLLADGETLLAGDDAFAVLTAHTPGIGGDRLAEWLADAFGAGVIDVEELELLALSGARLFLGWSARWTRGRR